MSCLKTINKYHDSDDAHFRTRCVMVKEQRAEEVKHHLMVLWADFFAPAHFEAFPNLHQLFWDAVHQAGEVKKSTDAAVCAPSEVFEQSLCTGHGEGHHHE